MSERITEGPRDYEAHPCSNPKCLMGAVRVGSRWKKCPVCYPPKTKGKASK